MRVFRPALLASVVVCSAGVVSCLSLDGFSGGALDGGVGAGDAAAPGANEGAASTWCSAADGGLGHTTCFDFDDRANAFLGWTNVVGAVAPDPSVAVSPLRSAFASLAGDGGAVRFDGGAEERLVRRFDQPATTIVFGFDLRADAVPSAGGVAFATIAFYASAGERVPEQSLALVLSSTRTVLTERLHENGKAIEHALQRSLGVDGTFHRVEITVRLSAGDGGAVTVDATIDGERALAGEPMTFLVPEPSVATTLGLYTVDSADPALVAAHYDDVTIDITP